MLRNNWYTHHTRLRRPARLAVVVVAALAMVSLFVVPGLQTPTGDPPAPSGYFKLVPAGRWSTLPGDATCASRIRRSTWEPRPSNALPNRTTPDVAAVHAALAVRPRVAAGGYDARWDKWLLPRVTGQHTGTTDENIQWAACKWGLPDNLVRAVADVESTWYQDERHASGACVNKRGCGDFFPQPSAASGVYCREIARYGYDYQKDFGARLCPKTFSIIGVMSWEDPKWGPMRGNQNGTFPFNRDSTAYALDYYGSFIRGCLEGWAWFLTGTPKSAGGAGSTAAVSDRLSGCVGAWFAGAWRTKDANAYEAQVRRAEASRVWLHRP